MNSPRKRYPLTEADFIAMHRRMKAGMDCYIPCREAFTFKGGDTIALLSWGSPVAYELVVKDGEVYHQFRYEDATGEEREV